MRKRITIPMALLGLAGVMGAPAAVQAAVSDAVIIALNSVKLDRDAEVVGDVVVNEAATAATLEPGFELSIDRGVTVHGDVRADSVEIDGKATINGTVECNDGDVGCAGLGLPVFQPLPPFRAAVPADGSGANCTPGGDCLVASGTQILAFGAYRDISVAPGATLELTGGGYDAASFSGGDIAFTGASQLRVAGDFHLLERSTITAGSGLSGRDLVIYVGGSAHVGKLAELAANFHVAGLFHLDRDSSLSGSVIAFDADFDKNADLDLDSAFNLAPVADPLTVITSGGAASFDLTGSDADGDTLEFTLVSGPSGGSLAGLPASDAADPTASVPVSYTGGTDGVADSFVFMVDDGKGGTDTAIVNINPSETCVDDGDCDPGFFCNTGAQPPVCTPNPLTGLIAQDDFYETAADTPIDVLLTAQAPDSVGDLVFQITAQPPAGEGSVSTPPTPASPRSASVTFTPAAGFIGQTGFEFEACEAADPGNCDQANITIDVQAFTAPAPPVATPQSVTTTQETQVDINLANPNSTDGPASQGGRDTLCGNGTLDQGEQCDDGNLLTGDGCDDQCMTEPQ